MGGPICANLLRKSGCSVLGYDLRPEPLARLAEKGLEPRDSAEDVARDAMIVFLSLPGGPELEAVGACLLGVMRPGAVLVDLSTAPVDLTRDLAGQFAGQGIAYADAPVARTRFAAERGELSVMVGTDAATFACIEPFLRCFASDVLHCGEVGAGQVTKLLNNMVLFEIGGASPRRWRSAGRAASSRRCCSRRSATARPTALPCATTAATRCCRKTIRSGHSRPVTR